MLLSCSTNVLPHSLGPSAVMPVFHNHKKYANIYELTYLYLILSKCYRWENWDSEWAVTFKTSQPTCIWQRRGVTSGCQFLSPVVCFFSWVILPLFTFLTLFLLTFLHIQLALVILVSTVSPQIQHVCTFILALCWNTIPPSLRDSNSTQLQGSHNPLYSVFTDPSSPFSFSGLALQFPALAYCHHCLMDVNHSYQNILWAARGQVPCFNMPSVFLSAVISPL